jgi:cytolysin (calcineurin-like family phosphatase)
MSVLNRRQFLAAAASGLGVAASGPAPAADPPAEAEGTVSFFLVGDTHYLADQENPKELDAVSRGLTSRLVAWLIRLPGTAIPEAAGGGTVVQPRGLIHAGDVIDSGDKDGQTAEALQQAEWRGFEADFGLTGKDGRLPWPVYEVHGNHDAPRGEGLVLDAIKRRNQRRPGLTNVSANGLHYSWDWGPVHFVNLGIVVGSAKGVTRRRRYAPLDSLPFLADDLAGHAGDRRRPVVVTHHVDVARYGGDCDPGAPDSGLEWDPCDVRGYHEAIRPYNVVGVLYGHTHARNVFRWDGTKSLKAAAGVPVFNTTRASHFQSRSQGLMYGELTDREFVVREFATTDGWETGQWTPAVWRVPLRRG